MIDNKIYPVYWSERSLAGSLLIKEYLQRKFSQKEIDNFYRMLGVFEKLVSTFPQLYPKSLKNKKVHRAVLSKQLSVFYTFSKKTITVIAVLDNRVSYSQWP